ncbi:MAG: hypothetical protein RIF32_12570 [Leptospirales bacterium]|jgi:hypothetical protein
MLIRVSVLYAGATALVLSLSAGAMWAEAVVLVDFWRAVEPAAFLEWYAAHNAGLVAFYSPLQITATALAVGLPIVLRYATGRWFVSAISAAVLAVGVIALFFVFFKSANAEFLSADPTLAARIPELLQTWGAWQWFRTALGAAAAACALAALRG